MSEIEPVHYVLHLRPDLEKFVFDARLDLTLKATKPTTEIALNVLALEIEWCRLQTQKGWSECRFAVDAEAEILKIDLPLETEGKFVLAIKYSGKIGDNMAGFYRSAFELDGQKSHIAVTQFQESDARRAFPCIDHPAAKATFDIAMDIDPHLTAIANQVVEETRVLENGKKRVRFATTPKMSTYLLFLGVGPFESQKDETDSRVSAAVLPGRITQTSFGLDFGAKALKFCEDYYDIPYPLKKMDLIGVPDFAFGAMENWGAITFRENLLLHDPEVTSQSGRVRICEVIAHEIVHQWFGNLVTPAEWKFLWLNESFATYFGFGVVDHHHPDWAIWEQFLHTTTATALIRDGLVETFAIEIPGGAHVVINASTAPLIYNKGASILRQVEGYIGAENFKAGLQHYLKGHAYGTASSHHLWEAFEDVAKKPVDALMKSWIQQPGYPLIEVKRDEDRLSFVQQRFTYLSQDFDQTWLVPIDVQFYLDGGGTKTESILLESRSDTLAIPAGTRAYKLNLKQSGFYRVHYQDKKNLAALGKLVAEGILDPIDRWGLINDLYGLVQKNRVTFGEFISFLDAYQDEAAFLPLAGITTCIKQAGLILAPDQRNRLCAWAAPWFERALDRIGFEPKETDDPATIMLRDQMLWAAAMAGAKGPVMWAQDRFEGLLKGRKVHPDIMQSIMQIGAKHGGQGTFDWFKKRFETSVSEHERLNILTALGGFESLEMIDAVLDYVLEGVPDRNKFIPVAALAENPAASQSLWVWYNAKLSRIEKLHPLIYERVIAAIISGAGMAEPEAVASFFKSYKTQKPPMADVINLSLEKLTINHRMRTWCETK